jgi:hypothetical protein
MFNELFGLSVLELVRNGAVSADNEPETELSISLSARFGITVKGTITLRSQQIFDIVIGIETEI